MLNTKGAVLMSRIMHSRVDYKKIFLRFFLIILIIILVIAVFFALSSIETTNKVLKGISVNGVDLSGMDSGEVHKTLNDYKTKLENTEYVFEYGSNTYKVKGRDFGIDFSGDPAIKALDYGKNGTFTENMSYLVQSLSGTEVNLTTDFIVDKSELSKVLTSESLLGQNSAVAQDAGYEIEDDKITIKKGKDGIRFVEDSVISEISRTTTADKNMNNSLIININEYSRTDRAEEIDVDDIYEKVYVEKKDATYDKNESGDIIFVEGVRGISFDIKDAKDELSSYSSKDSVTVDVIYTEPDVTLADLNKDLYQNELSKATTNLSDASEADIKDLGNIVSKINEYTLVPNEEFSFNKVVGTSVKNADQVASTLYVAVLKANINLKSINRKAHDTVPSYTDKCFDAVAGKSGDFKFTNSKLEPIKIVATSEGGRVDVTIVGTKEKNDPAVVDLEINTLESNKFQLYRVSRMNQKGTSTKDRKEEVSIDTYKELPEVQVAKVSKIVETNETKIASTNENNINSAKKQEKVEQKAEPKVENIIVEENNSDIKEDETSLIEVQDVLDNEVIEDNNNGIPTGWDSPENPYYHG